jgi:hypothetical protein
MAMDIEVLTESLMIGKQDAPPPESANGVADFASLLTAGVEDGIGQNFRVLQYVTPYDMTVFNSLQIPAVLDDLDLLQPYVRTSAERRAFDAVVDLAKRVTARSTFLVFLGD